MQAIMEPIFDIAYLVLVMFAGIFMVAKSGGNSLKKLIGISAIVLSGGDAFHLVPRIIMLWDGGNMLKHAVSLGFGKAVTSVTMTIFYVLLFYIWKKYFNIKECKAIEYSVWALSAARILLCLFPQNDWLSADSPLSWGIYRNIPFLILGILMIAIFFKTASKGKTPYKFMWLAILLSFAFYIPVVLFADTIPIIGMLMLPKTIMYAWMIKMGYNVTKEVK